jgi:hypothetical protein
MSDQTTGDPDQSQPGLDPAMGSGGSNTGLEGTGDADLSQPAGDPSMGGDDVDAGEPREGRS